VELFPLTTKAWLRPFLLCQMPVPLSRFCLSRRRLAVVKTKPCFPDLTLGRHRAFFVLSFGHFPPSFSSDVKPLYFFRVFFGCSFY